MNKTLHYDLSRLGLGSLIIAVSMLLDSRHPLHLRTTPDNTALIDLKKIFAWPDSQLALTVVDQVDPELNISPMLSDHGKFFSPYFTAPQVQVMGRTVPTNRSNRPSIAFATYNQSYRNHPTEDTGLSYPYNRYYNHAVWKEIFYLVMEAGYDVVVINDYDIPLEQKVFWLAEHCEAVIGYEGGVTHLAHTLDIPVILLPWHHSPEGGTKIEYAAERVQVDRRTWFLQDEHEILNWTTPQLKDTIRRLQQGQGNSMYFDAEVQVHADLSVSRSDRSGYDFSPWIKDFERDFIYQYIPSRIPGGSTGKIDS